MITNKETNMRSNSPEVLELEVWIGLDWGDKNHAFALRDRSGHCEEGTLEHSAENLHRWLEELATRYGSRPVALAIEASRGGVIQALLQYSWLTIYPINPVTSARYRSAFTPSGAKDDLPDAVVLLDLVRVHADKLRALETQDPATVKLAGLVEARRGIVDRRGCGLDAVDRPEHHEAHDTAADVLRDPALEPREVLDVDEADEDGHGVEWGIPRHANRSLQF